MNKQMMMRSGVAGAIAATGLVVGGVAVASADDEKTSGQTTTQDRQVPGPPDGRGGPGGPGAGPGDPAGLAEALGVSEDALAEALSTIREERQGDESQADGERPDPEKKDGEMAADLAEQLDLSEDEVTAALEKVRSAAEEDRRAALSERLDTAVGDGDLTKSDAAAVLKALDAGVLGGPGQDMEKG